MKLLDQRPTPRSEWWRWYTAYLQSDKWFALRERVLARARERCEAKWRGVRCTGRATQAHHLTYVRVGRERLTDLMAVCSTCHKRIHRRRKK